MLNTEDKPAWCSEGERQEKYFVEVVAPELGIDCVLNPDKEHDKYAFDLIYKGEPADLKYIQTPFFLAHRFGFNPSDTITFNHKDYLRYMYKYPKLKILFYVNWNETTNYGIFIECREGLWLATIERIDWLITHRKTGYHEYKKRVADAQGNAKASHVLSLASLECIYDSGHGFARKAIK